MRFLFLSYSFPGPLGPMAQWLGRDPQNQVIFASSRFRQELPLDCVQRVILKKYQCAAASQTLLELWGEALDAANSCAATLKLVAERDFCPDMIFNASSNGIFLGSRQVYSDIFTVNFLENDIFPNQALSAMRGDMEALQILGANLNYHFPGASLLSCLEKLKAAINPAPLMVDAEYFSPPQGESRFQPPLEVAIFCGSRPGFCARICGRIRQLVPGCSLKLIAANSFVLRKLVELAKPDQSVAILSWPKMPTLRGILQGAALCLFVEGNPDFLPAESCGAPVFFIPGDIPRYLPAGTRLLAGLSPEQCAEKLAALLAQPEKLQKCGAECREIITAKYAASTLMPTFFTKIMEAYGKWRAKMQDKSKNF